MRQFGVKRETPEAEPFLYFDEAVRYSPTFGELDLLDFLETAANIDDAAPSSMVVMKDVMRVCIHPDDFDRFWSTAKRERQGVADLLPVLYGAVEAVTDRPTRRPSDSSDGPPATAPNSTDGSSSRVISRLESEGRPDLALLVQRSTEGRRTA